METLNLRWEELGIKEEQLKSHIQKFEQFIQVPSAVGWSRLEHLHCSGADGSSPLLDFAGSPPPPRVKGVFCVLVVLSQAASMVYLLRWL